MNAMMYPAWSHDVKDVLKHHKVDAKEGLEDVEAERRLEEFGPNELKKPEPASLLAMVLEQFDDTLVKILLLAACISFGLAFFEGEELGVGAFVEPGVILLILILNAIVGVWQEANAESALEALKEMSAETAKVIRGGKMVAGYPAAKLVPGDVIEICAGDRVPADCRLVEMKTAILRAEQAALTGESVAVQKSVDALTSVHSELQSKDTMLFAGTGIASGNGICVVNSTGMNTEIGKIQEQIEEAAKEDDDTPLKRNLDEFGEALAKIILGVCILVWVININHFLSFKFIKGTWIPDTTTIAFSFGKATFYFKVAVALAVAAIPEGLPAVITTCLALGTRKMAKRNAIVRQLPSVETLGCTSIICSDKTGTLTTNQMSAITLVALGASTTDVRDLKVTGTSFDPDGGEVVGLKSIDSAVEAVARVCALCNDSRVVVQHDSYKAIGQPTESALLVMTEKIGVSTGQDRIKAARKHDPTGACTEYASAFKKVATLEFDRDRKSMSVLCKPLSEGEAEQNDQDSVRRSPRKASRKAGTSADNMLFVKGAAECILERCSTAMLSDGSVVPIDTKLRSSLSKIIDDKAEHALRLLAMAVKKGEDLGDLATYDGSQSHAGFSLISDPSKYDRIESDLTFVGLAGLRDPPRPEVAQAIEGCHSAGIRVMVITGDNKLTAEAVCRDIGIFAPGQDTEDASLTGAEFLAMPDLEKKNLLNTPGGICFSRAEPRHKQEIVRILKDMGEIVAMTGDGVNDAPALKLADIGVAMGIAGTEVAKQASDMVLADDNFATVVAAVEEGRSIYDNMKAFIRYMISSNIGEVVSIFLSAALGLPEGLVPVQLLWVNLVTDGPPATALGFNKADPDIMQKPPRRSNEHFITPWILFRWLVVGLYVGFATVAVFAVWYTHDSFMGIDFSDDGHTVVTFDQLRNWESCESWRGFKAAPFTAGSSTVSFDTPCDYFSKGKIKASTLSLSVLVAIEMFNAANALSEDNSILKVPVWSNPWLLMAMAVSFGLHFLILYVPTFATTFSIVPLSINEWLLVLLFALPVVILDEILKFIGRNFINKQAPPAEMAKDKDV
ncbi:hypothetical protein M9434_003120 [Picochlorum sp. BPE23]|nr:hypothetical protein M9434_003120 [Picochlorum sp. BPE23]